MSVPDSVTLHNLTGSYTMNKTLSDDTDPILKAQGVSWLVRQAVRYSTIIIKVVEYVDGAGDVHIDIQQESSGGFKNLEERTLNWAWGDKDDRIFGKVRGRTRWCQLEDVDEAFLRAGWDRAFLDQCKGEVVNAFVQSRGKSPDWTADQVWGFEDIEGLRRHVRRIVFRKGKEEYMVRTVYDWNP